MCWRDLPGSRKGNADVAPPAFSLGELAQRFRLELRGAADRTVSGVATLAKAEAHQLGFLANPRYRRELARTRAGVLVLHPDELPHWAGVDSSGFPSGRDLRWLCGESHRASARA